MLNEAKLPINMRNGLWAEAAATATMCENIICTENQNKPPYEILFKKEKGQARKLRTYG